MEHIFKAKADALKKEELEAKEVVLHAKRETLKEKREERSRRRAMKESAAAEAQLASVLEGQEKE